MNKNWVIYALRRDSIFYIGRSFNIKRRLQEHRKKFGKDFICEILEHGTGEGFNEAEQKWIARFLNDGFVLDNKTAGGNGGTWLSEESRELVAAAVRGRKCTWGDKIGAAMKGRPKNWSEDGLERVIASQFKKGNVPPYAGTHLPAEIRAKIGKKVSISLIGNSRRKGIPHDEATKKHLAESARLSGNGTPELMSARSKKFWAEMTPEYRAEYLKKREAARQASILKKKRK